jgi:hydrogenase-4 membrane subunit HyfE
MIPFLLAILILSTFFLAASGWMRGLFYISALQTWVVAVIGLIWRSHALHVYECVFLLAYVVIKGWLLPFFAIRLCRRVDIHREYAPFLSANISLIFVLVFIALAFSSTALLPDQLFSQFFSASPFFLPPALTLLMTGMFLWIARRLALSYLLAYLVITNGIALILFALKIQFWQLESVFLLGSTIVALAIGAFIPYLKQEFDHIEVSALKGQDG